MPTSFAVERTLGRLGKWLRLMGFDTLSEIDYPSGTFMRRIGSERTFLTRTRPSPRADLAQKTIFIQSNHPRDQARELICKAAIRREDLRPFSRCSLCNEPIVWVSKDAVQRLVPDYVWETQAGFCQCPKCSRVYWKGSHTERGLERISEMFHEPSKKTSG
jgi:uncharacterized protein with PIN domain